MANKDDWRITEMSERFRNKELYKRQYTPYSEEWNHEHCEFCWDTFSEYEGDLHEGYCTEDENIWICEECYEDFKEMFNFTLMENHND